MAEVTVEEPRSVVEEVTKYKCDRCKALKDADETYSLKLSALGDDVSVDGHLCRDCAEAENYATLRDAADFDRKMYRFADIFNGIAWWAGGLGCGFSAAWLLFSVFTMNEKSLVAWFIIAIVLTILWFVILGFTHNSIEHIKYN